MVAVQVTVLAPPVPELLHSLMVVGRPVDCEGGAVTVQVSVPPGPPELLHCVTLWPPGPPLPAWLLPGGVAVQVSVLTAAGFWHCRTVAAIAEPVGYPVRSLVTVTVHVTVLAPPGPASLHWVMLVTGNIDVVVLPGGQAAEPVQETVMTMVADPFGWLGAAGLYVKSLVTVTLQVTVAAAAREPTLLHWLIGKVEALAGLPPPPAITTPNATTRPMAPRKAMARPTGSRRRVALLAPAPALAALSLSAPGKLCL